MPKWIPAVAVVGLLALMIIPAPGIWGVLIGATCSLAIIASAVMWVLDRIATRILAWRDRVKQKRRPKRRPGGHTGSSVVSKA